MDLYDVMRTTGSTRAFRDDPVSDGVLTRILDHARFAGSGGNRQPWHVIVVRNRDLRRRIRDLNQPIWDTYIAARSRGEVPFAPGWDEPDEVAPHAQLALLDQFERVPVVLIVCAHLGSLAVTDQALDRQSIVAGASVYPFVHNLLLAATNEGLGAVLTTLAVRAEPELRPLLGIPASHAMAAMVAIGHPTERITKLRRRAVGEFTTVDRFDGSAWG